MLDLISMFYNSLWRSVLLSSFYFQGVGATERLSVLLKLTQLASAKPQFEPSLSSAEPDAMSTIPCRLPLATSVAEQKPKLPVAEPLQEPDEIQRWGRGRSIQRELLPFTLINPQTL